METPRYRQASISRLEVPSSKQPKDVVTVGRLLAIILKDAGYDTRNHQHLEEAAERIGYGKVNSLKRVLEGKLKTQPRRTTVNSIIAALDVRPGMAEYFRELMGY